MCAGYKEACASVQGYGEHYLCCHCHQTPILGVFIFLYQFAGVLEQ